MKLLGHAWRILAVEGFGALLARSWSWGTKRLRFLLYRFKRKLPWGRRADIPLNIIHSYLPKEHADIVEKIWSLSVKAPVKVLVPDYMCRLLEDFARGTGQKNLQCLSYSAIAESPRSDFDTFWIDFSLVHNLPRSLLDKVADEWQLVCSAGSSLLLSSRLSQPCDKLTSEAGLDDLRVILDRLDRLRANDHIYVGAYGAKLRCRYSATDLGIIEEASNEYFGWGIEVRPNANVVDIGAHIGAFAVPCGMRLQRGTVYAYEPAPENYNLLVENLSRNCPGKVEAFQEAVYSHRCMRPMHLDNENSGGNKLSLPSWSQQQVMVQCIGFEEVLARVPGMIDILKMDVEGSEYKILFPHGDLLKKRVRTILIEAHADGLKTGLDMVSFLEGLGFLVQRKGDRQLMLIRAESESDYAEK